MERILDFSQPVDVPFLDQVVETFYRSTNPEEVTSPQRICFLLRSRFGCPRVRRRAPVFIPCHLIESVFRE